MKKILLLFFTFLLLSACKNNVAKPNPSSVVGLPFFDLKGYFEKEITRLEGIKKGKKTSVVNDKREEKTLDSLDFRSELKIFSSSDINRPAWADKYDIEELFNPKGQQAETNYLAKSEKLKTRKISIEFEAGKVSKIFIENRIPSLIATTRQRLSYRPQKGYSIEINQKVIFSADNYFLVEVAFEK